MAVTGGSLAAAQYLDAQTKAAMQARVATKIAIAKMTPPTTLASDRR